jgi:hypothetical protein
MNATATPALSAKGTSGELRHGYHLAATFGEWTLTVHRESPTTTADAVVTISTIEPDGYWFHEQPQDMRVQVGARVWVWREVEKLDDTRYRVVGDPEVQ